MASEKQTIGGPSYTLTDAQGKKTTVASASGGNVAVSQHGFSMVLNKTSAQDLLTLLQAYISTGGIT